MENTPNVGGAWLVNHVLVDDEKPLRHGVLSLEL